MATVIVDGNNIAMAAYAANDQLLDPYGRPVGAIYGPLRMMKPMLDRVREVFVRTGEPVKFLVAWDARRSWRHDAYEGYKAGRKDKDTDEFFQRYVEQLPRLREILPQLGIGQILVDNFEADDIAGWLTQRSGKWVLMSNDKDWLQLVRDGVWVWRPKDADFVTPDTFAEKAEADDPEQFVTIKAIAGDKGDDVPGCKGIGWALARKYLTGGMKPGSARANAIEAWLADPEGYARSRKLVDLRAIQPDPRVQRVNTTAGAFDQRKFMQSCVELGFQSIIERFDDWAGAFKPAMETA